MCQNLNLCFVFITSLSHLHSPNRYSSDEEASHQISQLASLWHPNPQRAAVGLEALWRSSQPFSPDPGHGQMPTLRKKWVGRHWPCTANLGPAPASIIHFLRTLFCALRLSGQNKVGGGRGVTQQYCNTAFIKIKITPSLRWDVSEEVAQWGRAGKLAGKERSCFPSQAYSRNVS